MKKYYIFLFILTLSVSLYSQQVTSDCEKTCIVETVIYKDAFLGVKVTNTKKQKQGGKIIEIYKNTAAEKSVFQLSDAIEYIDDIKVKNHAHLGKIIGGMEPFDKIKVKYKRGTKTKKVSVVLGAKRIYIEKSEICCDSEETSIVKDQVSLYPNPVKTELNFSFKNAIPNDDYSFEIFSMEGVKHISKTNQKLENRISKKINIKALANGSYVIRIVKGNKVYSKQFLVLN